MKKIAMFLFLFGAVLTVRAQKLTELYANSIKCRQHQNFQGFLKYTRELDSIRPCHPTYVYNLACAYALNGIPYKAFSVLEKSILMDNSVKFETEPDLESLKILPDYQRLVQLKSDLAKETATSSKVAMLTEKDLHPEGFVYLPKAKTWLAGSVRKGKIVSFDIKTGKCKDWLVADGMFSVMAIKPDADEKYLWVATSAMPEMVGFTKDLDGKAAILKVDIKKQKIVARYTALGRHVFGDLVVAKSGKVYISDSYGASIYKIEADDIAHWIDLPGPTYNMQGMAFNDDETKLYIADYFSGILEIPMADTKSYKWLAFPKGTVTKGIDGLSWYKNSLIAVHNGVKPIRIIRYFLDTTGDAITGYKMIDNSRAEFDEPVCGTVKDGKFYFFANCPWNAYDKAHNLDENKFRNPMLYSFRLE